MLAPTLWNVTIYAVAWTLQVVRMNAEERFLSQDEAYRVYKGAVRYRLIPGVY
jgi:protein-S-isoprenylcysteine O-methyltransferase Ste14